jgi:hypothetical protein
MCVMQLRRVCVLKTHNRSLHSQPRLPICHQQHSALGSALSWWLLVMLLEQSGIEPECRVQSQCKGHLRPFLKATYIWQMATKCGRRVPFFFY